MITISLSILSWLIVIYWINSILIIRYSIQNHSLIKSTSKINFKENLPPISVIVSAKNEEEDIEKSVESLLSLDYPNIELIVVNDRSTDNTGKILEKLSKKHANLKPVHIQTLPEGWIGKSHGLYEGSKMASADWILFSDGDVIFENDALKLAMKYAVSKKLDHLVLIPFMIPTGYLHNAVINTFDLTFITSIKPRKIATSDKNAYVGVGGFNLVRRSLYNKAGGHASIRFDVIDDVKLGKLIKKNNGREDFLFADGQVKFRWYKNVGEIITGLEKNFFASVDYSILKVLLSTLMFLMIYFMPIALLFIKMPLYGTIGAILSILLSHILSAVYARKVGYSIGAGLGILPGVVIMIITLWRSMLVTLMNKGVKWRDTFYPLKDLKKYNY